MDAHVLDIQAIFLIRAIGMLDVGTIAPFGVDGLCLVSGMDGHIGDQDQSPVEVRVVSDQNPQHVKRFREANLEPA